jgi:hypothetical protein
MNYYFKIFLDSFEIIDIIEIPYENSKMKNITKLLHKSNPYLEKFEYSLKTSFFIFIFFIEIFLLNNFENETFSQLITTINHNILSLN